MSTFPLLLIVACLFGGMLVFLLQAEGGWQQFPRLLKEAGLTIPSPSPAPTRAAQPRSPLPYPAAFTSGNSRFSQGACTQDNQCQVSGCSGEVCGRTAATTTCEWSDSFPSAQGLSCGCVKSHCGWE